MYRPALALGLGALWDVFVGGAAKSLALCRHADVVISVSLSRESLLACLGRISKQSLDLQGR